MSIHDNLNSPLLKRVKANEEALNGLQEGAGNPTKIATGTDVYIEDGAALPIIDLKLTGKSVQNGTPTPDAPQTIHNVGDCVEMISGYYNVSGGAFGSSQYLVCNKLPIPCESGDIVEITTENEYGINVLFYNENSYKSYDTKDNVKKYSFTIPSDITYFNFNIGSTSVVNTQTVGKISLTINGKYVVQIPYANKNLITVASSITKESAGYVFDKTTKADLKAGTQYVFSCVTSVTQSNKMQIGLWYKDGTSGTVPSFSSTANQKATCVFTPAKDVEAVSLYQGVGAMVITECQIERGTVATDYEPFKETVTTVFLDAPLCDKDAISKTEIARNRIKFVYDGSDDENWQKSSVLVGRYLTATNKPLKLGWNARGLCSQAIFGTETTEVNRCYITASAQISINTNFSTFEEWKAHLQANPLEVECELEEPIIETLDSASQAALNAIETFNPITHITVDSSVKPEISVEYVHKAYESIVNSLIEKSAAPEEWKEVGVANGNAELALPEDWTELSIAATSLTFKGIASIPRIVFERFGNYDLPIIVKAPFEIMVKVRVTKETVYATAYYENGTAAETIPASLNIIAYYK